jgi:parallel beta-helix repeat protein
MHVPSFKKARSFLVGALWLTLILANKVHAKTWFVEPSDHLEFDAQEALLSAKPGDTVLLPEGRFAMTTELSLITPHITLKGQGIDKTVLVYTESATGPQAIISMADHTTVEDLTIINHPGDGVKMVGVDGAYIRRVKVEWTEKGSSTNGAYGLYPVMAKNVLMEDNVVIGASDAGIYVGQSKSIIVRRNRVEYNVAGIEIENSQNADVYENYLTNNTGGILVFNLPNLLVQGGKGTRLFRNTLYKNNFKNFAPAGTSVALVPQGTGVLVMGNDDIEIFDNTLDRHNTTSIAVVSYHITERPVEDPNYDALPENIHIHSNRMTHAGRWPLKGANPLGLVVGAHSFPHRIPHITYDGIGQPDGEGGFKKASLQGDRRLCIGENEHDGGESSYFGNFNLWQQLRLVPIPGNLERDMTDYTCSLPALAKVELDPKPEPPQAEKEQPTEGLCDAEVEGVNWGAYIADCPRLSDYNLFQNSDDPLGPLNEGGFGYEMNTPLFSDYASKRRAIFLPPGTSASYNEGDILSLPIGSIVAKTFHFPHDLRQDTSDTHVVETRLIIRRETGWASLEYVWQKDTNEALLKRGGSMVHVSWIDKGGMLRENPQYPVPNLAQCVSCHINGKPIGIRAGYLNRDGGVGPMEGVNQLKYLESIGRLKGLPSDFYNVPRYPVWNKPETGSLEERARTYLDINCAHCHSLPGKANTSALFLNIDRPMDINYGICKPPIAAGRGAGGTLFDIVPGSAEESILITRMNSTKAAIKMPEVGKSMVHAEGVDLISEWINSMPGQCASK